MPHDDDPEMEFGHRNIQIPPTADSALADHRRRAAAEWRASRTSMLHLDVLHDPKRIDSHLAAAAYPVLEPIGELLPTWLRREVEPEEI